MPANTWTVYGARGWGSSIAEALLVRCGAAYDFVDVKGFDKAGIDKDNLERARLQRLTPWPQTHDPGHARRDGDDRERRHRASAFGDVPQYRSGPRLDQRCPMRPRFLRRLVWLAASVYSTFLYADYPGTLAPIGR